MVDALHQGETKGKHVPHQIKMGNRNNAHCLSREHECKRFRRPDPSCGDTDLTAIKAALVEITDTDLHALIAATYGVPQTAPWLLAWIDGACDWELNRRRGFDYPLLPPEAAIDPSEDEVSINAALVIRAMFAQDSPAVLALFDALVELLTGAGRKQ